MRFNPTLCPKCQCVPQGTLETVPGVASLFEVEGESGVFEYEGYTDMWWDGQTTIRDAAGLVTLTCGEHEWKAEMIEEPDTKGGS